MNGTGGLWYGCLKSRNHDKVSLDNDDSLEKSDILPMRTFSRSKSRQTSTII
jgi:hypothetical protein